MNQNEQPATAAATWFNQGLTAQDCNKITLAIDAYLQVLRFDPQHFAATYNLATLYHEQNQFELARKNYIDAIKRNPTSALPYKGLGDIFFTTNDIDQALLIYNQALKIAPEFAEVWYNIGLIELHRHNLSDAFKNFRRAVRLRPDYKSALDGLLKLEFRTGQTTETVIFLTNLREEFPQNTLLSLALAEIFYNHHQSDKALNLIDTTLKIDINNGEAFNLLGLIQLRQGEAEAARLTFRKALNLAPDSLKIHSNLLYATLTDPTITATEYRQEADLWWRRHGAELGTDNVLSHERALEKNRTLRLGFISGDFHRHSVSFFFLPLITNLSQTTFETFCYSDSITNDDYTDKIKEQSDHWHSIYGLNSETVAQMIATDKIDILFELSGHTANNRLSVIAQKPAPVQFSWLGYPASTGIANGTFRLTDNVTDPASFKDHYSEDITYIRSPFLCYDPPPEAYNLVPEKRLNHTDEIVFASFNNTAKINQNVIETWAQILKRVPRAKILFKTRTLKDDSLASKLKKRFSTCGINPERISISGENFSATDHFKAYNQVDIALDPFPYNGTTTTCDALWMGVPVITLRGKTHADRVGTSLMQALGCPELIADNLYEYVDKSVALAENPAQLADYHNKIRALIQNSSLMNGSEFARDFSRAIISRWNEWRKQKISLLQRLIQENRESLKLPHGVEKLLTESGAALNLLNKSLENHDAPYLFLKLGQKYANKGEFKIAYECFREAVAGNKDNFAAHFTLAHTLQKLERNDEALLHYRKSLDLNPKLTNAAINLSKLLSNRNESEQALAILLEVRKLVPNNNDVDFQLANIYYDLNMLEDAYETLKSCLKLEPKQAGIWNNLGYLMAESGKSEKAAECYRLALSFNPDMVESQTNLLWHLAQTCNWEELEQHRAKTNSLSPLLSIIFHNNLELNLKSVQNSLKKKLTKETFHMSRPNPTNLPQKSIIKIGYLSCDFRDHPVAHNMLNLFRLHNRKHFHITAYSCGKDDGSKYRQQIRKDCDSFVDLQKFNDLDSAKKIHADGIDILIELMGHTRENRLGICAFRPAPIQISYLGYPGTTGADFIDYLIADEIVIPPQDKIHYREEIIYLPNCFMVADQAPIGPRPQRADCGLPESGFIFCSFNTPFKIEPVMFKVWMDILNEVADASLWLREGSELYEKNLRMEAKKHRINPERLIFAPRVADKEDHLARLQLAGLALDTRIYNGHTTTLDALWAGVPVLTTNGTHFASRVSDSNLKAIGLTEMITANLDDYREMAIELAQDHNKLKYLKQKLNHNQMTMPLFDTETTVKNLESVYREIWQLKLGNQNKSTFSIEEY